MNLLPHVFSAVVAQSGRIGLLILVWMALRPVLRGRVPQQILFAGWIVLALGLLIPISLPVAWSPFNFVRPTSDLAGEAISVPPQSITTAVVPHAPAALVTPTPAMPRATARFWTRQKIIAIIWLTGIGGLLGVRLLVGMQFYGRLRRSPAQASPQIDAMVTECAKMLRITRSISVRMTDAAGGPALGGLIRPVVFIPNHLPEVLTTDELRLVILHELGHWRRGDTLVNFLSQAALVLHWFNPLVWIAVGMTRADCELACDEFVMRHLATARTHEYGATLLKVLAMGRGSTPALAVLGILENKKLLKRRIQMIADYRVTTVRRAFAGWALLALLAVAVVTREMRAQPATPPAPSTPPAAPTPAVASVPATAPAPAASDNGYYVDSKSRFQHGQELAKKGKYAEALAEYLWCYDEGMIRESAMGGVRNSFLVSSIAKLGKDYPPALQALRDRLANAKARLRDHPADYSATSDFGALNHALGDDAATLAYYDQLPVDNPARRNLGFHVFPLLLEAKRYSDAVTAYPYERFLAIFSIDQTQMKKRPQTMAKHMLNSGAQELEALAGAGKFDDARDLIKRLLEVDQSDTTQNLLRTHLERAGHPELLGEPKATSTP